MQKYRMRLKDEDGTIYEYRYDMFTWNEGGPLLIYDYAGMKPNPETAELESQMVMKAKFQNCRAILEITEVEDESEG